MVGLHANILQRLSRMGILYISRNWDVFGTVTGLLRLYMMLKTALSWLNGQGLAIYKKYIHFH